VTPDINRRRPGRPKKPPSEVKRNKVNVAFADPTYRAIKEAAEANGRSVSSEIDWRLARSFRDDDVAEAIWSRLAERPQ
jgi:hypothetical protein